MRLRACIRVRDSIFCPSYLFSRCVHPLTMISTVYSVQCSGSVNPTFNSVSDSPTGIHFTGRTFSQTDAVFKLLLEATYWDGLIICFLVLKSEA